MPAMPHLRLQFADITAPLGRDEFLRRYWATEGVLLRMPDRDFGRFCGWDAVNAILNAGDLTFPTIKLSRLDRPVSPERFTTTVGGRQLIDARAVVDEFRDGASFGITGADSHWPSLRPIVDCFHDALLESVHTNIYCSPARTQGFQCHYDLHEVFVLQVDGSKRWRVFAPSTDAPLESWSREAADEIVQTAPYIDAVLRKGDVLYVPRGHWHYAEAEESVSLHVTVGVSCRKGLEFLDWLTTDLSEEAIWRRNAPLLGDVSACDSTSPGGTTAEWLGELRNSLLQRLSDPTLFDRFLRDTIRTVHPTHAIDLLTQGDPSPVALERVVFEQPPGRPYVIDDIGPEVVVSVSGMNMQVEGVKPGIVHQIFSRPAFTLADVAGWDPDMDMGEVRALLTELVRSGLLLTRPIDVK